MKISAMKIAAVFLMVSAVIHLFSFTGAGLSGEAMLFVWVGVIYGAMAFGLWDNKRWLGWLTYFVMAVGMITAITWLGRSTIPDDYLMGIIAANAGVILCLFWALWRTHKVAE